MSRRSVLTMQFGQFGCQTGFEVWQLLCHEHQINIDGTPDFNPSYDNNRSFQSFFIESGCGNYVPKALFLDSEPGVLDALRTSSMGALFKDQFIMTGGQDCRNVMGHGYYPDFCGNGLHGELKNTVRKLHELCDSISGNLMYFSTSGGTGSGFSCRALQHCRELNNKSVCHALTLVPSPTISSNPMEYLNTTAYLGISRYDNLYMNVNTMFDNEALYRQAMALYGKYTTPTYAHINQLIAASVSSATASLRFDGQLNVDLNEFQTNLVPFPSMCHLYQTQAPLNANQKTDRISVMDITFETFEPSSHMISVNSFAFANKWTKAEDSMYWAKPPYQDDGQENKQELQRRGAVIPEHNYLVNHRFIGCSLMFRGDVMPARINSAMKKLTERRNPLFVPWVQTGFKIGVNSPPLRFPHSWPLTDLPRAVCCIINNTAIVEKFKQFVFNYRVQADNGLYSVWFEKGGISKDVVDRSMEGNTDLIEKYEQCMKANQEGDDVRDRLMSAPAEVSGF